MRSIFAILLVSLIVVVRAGRVHDRGGLKMKYYQKSCRPVEAIVRDITWRKVKANPTLPAKLLRLQFHDCFVRGCDASILLDSTKTNKAEKEAIPNQSISGYDVIDEIKKKLEEECPETVSCADIIALAARDAVSYQFQRTMWQVLTGRKDGKFSLASEVTSNLPSPFANFSTLMGQFSSKRLDIIDLVTLSGAHTIGRGQCSLFMNRLYNFTGKGNADPSLNPNYAKTLRRLCPKNAPNSAATVEIDPRSSLSFDSHYFDALNKNMGLFQSDAALLTNSRSAKLARILQTPRVFFARFARSMKKMSAIGVLEEGGNGEIRKNCRVVNA